MLRPLLLVSLLAGVAAYAADQPLRVYGYNAAGAAVYVAPTSKLGAGEASDSEIGPQAFARKYLRGKVPLEVALKPGQYLVSVVVPREQNMRDASLWAHDLVWDGYDYHALVPQRSGGWRYAQCYVVDKKEGFPAEVLAVFTDQLDQAAPQAYDCGPKATRYTGKDEDADEALTAGRIALTYHDDIIRGLKAGAKVLLNEEETRVAIQCDGPVSLRVQVARGAGAWAGHRLSIAALE
jgi:hypothetical protein